jgi:hypothetical protein
MNDLLRPDDESLREHLERRARRAHLDDDARGVVVRSVVDATATTRYRSRRSILGLLAAAAALVLVAVVVLPVALPLGGRPSPTSRSIPYPSLGESHRACPPRSRATSSVPFTEARQSRWPWHSTCTAR